MISRSRSRDDDEDDDYGSKGVTSAIRGKASRNWSSQNVGQTAANLARSQFGLHTNEQNVATANRAFGTAYNSILKTADQRLRNRTGTGSKLAEGLYKSPTLGVSYQKDKVALPFKQSGFGSRAQAKIHKQMRDADIEPEGDFSNVARDRPQGPYSINPNYDPSYAAPVAAPVAAQSSSAFDTPSAHSGSQKADLFLPGKYHDQ